MEKKCKNCINHYNMNYRQILCRRTNDIQSENYKCEYWVLDPRRPPLMETLIKSIIKPKER